MFLFLFFLFFIYVRMDLCVLMQCPFIAFTLISWADWATGKTRPVNIRALIIR